MRPTTDRRAKADGKDTLRTEFRWPRVWGQAVLSLLLCSTAGLTQQQQINVETLSDQSRVEFEADHLAPDAEATYVYGSAYTSMESSILFRCSKAFRSPVWGPETVVTPVGGPAVQWVDVLVQMERTIVTWGDADGNLWMRCHNEEPPCQPLSPALLVGSNDCGGRARLGYFGPSSVGIAWRGTNGQGGQQLPSHHRSR